MIRADLDPRSRPARRPRRGRSRAAASAQARAKTNRRKPRKRKPFRRRRRSRPGRGRAEGQGRAIPCSAPAPASRSSTRYLRRDPPAAGALRSRLALQSAAASAKILRLNADASALRDLRFAGDRRASAGRKAASAVARPGRPPTQSRRPPACRRRAASSTCPVAAADALAESLSEQSQGRGSGLRRRQGGRHRPLPPSRTPRPPTPRSWPFGRSTSSSRSGCAGRGPCR